MRQSNIFVTVDAIVFTRENPKKLLLIRRKNEPFKGTWAFPGGFVDQDEDLADAAKRELFEETGVDANPAGQVGAFGKPGRDPRHHTVSVAYLFHVPDNTPAVAADDATDARWFALGDLPELAFDHAEILESALKYTP